ncbi:MAG: Choline-sulfatase [bacterium]|nr:sulfatase-like hydrolase/transferase [bacterium]MBV6481833.1 Choline-sulfatase [bacterium]MCE7907059.1 DUF4976 domain-containing protein [Candidatus Omnitrophica bacterium COP1]
MKSDRPNILIICSDQHTPGVLGCYGNAVVQTPHLDALAGNGIVFDSAYCASPVCVASRLSMLTGRHPGNIGVWGLADTIPSTTPTWPMALSAAGWETVISGRMHLVYGDRNHGFEHRLCGDAYPTMRNHFAHWRNQEPDVTRNVKAIAEAGAGIARHDAEDDIAQGFALKYLHQQNPARRTRPFALCVGFYRPHTPYSAPEELAGLYRDFEPEITGSLEDLPPYYRSLARHFGLEKDPPTPAQARRAVQVYYSMVTGLDRRVGLLCQMLRQQGFWDNTIIIYTSDHGDMLGKHGLWFKSSFYEESVRVPLIIHWPERFRKGIRIKEPVSLIDLFPSLCDLAGIEPYDFLDGSSFLPALKGAPLEPGREVFAEYADYGIHSPMRMIRNERYKLIYCHQQDPLLFDLVDDPGETVNRANDPELADTVRSMKERLLSDWNPESVRERVLLNQQYRDILMQAEDSIRAATGTAGFPWH